MRKFYAILYVAVLGVVSHFIGNLLPRGWFDPERFPYKCYGWEQNGKIYQKLGVSSWKDKVTDMSKICSDMRPKTVRAGMSGEDMTALIAETSVAECIHWLLILLSPGIALISPNGFGWAFMLMDVLLLNLPFIVIQRYNRPRLMRLQAAYARKSSCKEEAFAQ